MIYWLFYAGTGALTLAIIAAEVMCLLLRGENRKGQSDCVAVQPLLPTPVLGPIILFGRVWLYFDQTM